MFFVSHTTPTQSSFSISFASLVHHDGQAVLCVKRWPLCNPAGFHATSGVYIESNYRCFSLVKSTIQLLNAQLYCGDSNENLMFTNKTKILNCPTGYHNLEDQKCFWIVTWSLRVYYILANSFITPIIFLQRNSFLPVWYELSRRSLFYSYARLIGRKIRTAPVIIICKILLAVSSGHEPLWGVR